SSPNSPHPRQLPPAHFPASPSTTTSPPPPSESVTYYVTLPLKITGQPSPSPSAPNAVGPPPNATCSAPVISRSPTSARASSAPRPPSPPPSPSSRPASV